MSDYQEAKDTFKKLSSPAKQLLMVDLLFDGTIDYTELSKMYVEVLQKQHQIEQRKLNDAGIRLTSAWDYIPSNKRFTKAAVAYAILQTGAMHTAPIEKEFEQYLKKNPYTLGDTGIPKTELRDEAVKGRPKKRQADE